MIRAVLFDLDGTLLNNDMERFMPIYLDRLQRFMAPYYPPEPFLSALFTAVREAIYWPDSRRTVWKRFAEAFERETKRPMESWMPHFERFYMEVFPSLRVLTEPMVEAWWLIERARMRGLRIAIATNPVFPEIAIRQRLEWAGLGDISFDWITTMENMHFTKPWPAYYQEVAARLEVPPEACGMIGNDWRQDIQPAQQVGMQTFWVCESGNGMFQKNQGDLRQALQWLENLN
ncbi:MAG: HAD family hydrolase [Anaerolineae bacterium]|nr:HAD family hydrolase [Thermoflexus sp.]MDW8065441.1 HAD family hydrolase [Anaerolineae bacterium]